MYLWLHLSVCDAISFPIFQHIAVAMRVLIYTKREICHQVNFLFENAYLFEEATAVVLAPVIQSEE